MNRANLEQYSPKGAKAAQPIPASRLEAKVKEALSSFEKPKVKLEKAEKQSTAAPETGACAGNRGQNRENP